MYVFNKLFALIDKEARKTKIIDIFYTCGDDDDDHNDKEIGNSFTGTRCLLNGNHSWIWFLYYVIQIT